ncbi:sarcosine oxidase subunit D [Rubrobacter xylanophilus DSM 9941]|uniref:Sarcosine oxidase subunit D n=1 Tax=Rubrobacter xylanophilus (strain DSM 9941 / JCM 11954 / NBRC 16129 / PRD-1) TaxID=266117 RepID=Q1AT59_RUBXD|nr:sarcosine oxidase subunit delta [Rubrobacter xylanophilus]ABG05419.1 sarcosine oxidase subunit D [Rubrobacter xylanophilus DSM 9941]
MKILNCPINGPRPIHEFIYGGEFRDMPDVDAVTDGEWVDYLYNRSGVPGIKREWWYHVASNVWFIAERDTATNVVCKTYLFEGRRNYE